MKYIKLLLLLPVFVAFGNTVQAQCNTNTSICTPGTAGPFTFVSPGTAVSTCLDWIGPNTGYIILHITSSGPLNMLIDGNASSGFLDVAVFNIPAGQSPCTAIQNTANQIGCNYASASSGCNQFGTYFPCSSSVPAPNVTAGQEIMIVVENWSGTSSNFTMQLGPPPGAQTGPPNPAITPVGPYCVTSPAVQLIAADMGGTWTGPGVSSTGMFNPATAGPGTHTINYSIGTAPCNASSSTTITVNSASVSVSPNTSICPGGSATLTASGAASYSWSPTTGLSPTSGPTVTASPASTTTYTVTGTTAGCTSTANVTVTVTPLTVTVSPNASICAGGSTTLTANGATNYTWSPTTGLSPTTGSTVTASPATTTTYTVTGTTGSCSNTANVTVTVTPITVTVSPDVTICNGTSTTLTAGGATNYTWTPTTGLSPTTGATVTASPTTTTTYTVTGTTGSCSNTADVTVTVNPIPSISASNNGPLCAGQTFNLTANGSATATYSWTGPNGFSSNLQNPSGTASAASAGTYTVTITENGCSATATTTLAISSTAVPTINAAGPFCANAPSVYMSSNMSGGTWSGSGIVNGSTGEFSPAAATIGNNTITYTVPGGCSTPATATVQVNPLPTVAISTPLTVGCEPFTAVIQDNSTPPSSYIVWDFGDGTTSTDLNNTTHTFNSPGCYNVTATSTSANGCTSTASFQNFICVTPYADASFIVDNTVQSIMTPMFTVTNTSTNATTYWWDFGDGATSNAVSGSHSYTESAGSYQIMLVANNAGNCPDTAYTTVVVKEQLVFYVPNTFTPDGDEYNNEFVPVFTSGFDPYNYTLTIYDRWGEILFESHNVEQGWDGAYQDKPCSQGSYTWTIRFKSSESDQKKTYSGHIFLIK